MPQALSIILLWIIVPGIMISVLCFSILIVNRTSKPEFKTSARAGLWAGLILFVVFVISQLNALRNPTFNLSNFPTFSLSYMFIGFIIGFPFLWGLKYLVPTRLVGLISLTLAASSSSALFSYIFFESIRSKMVFLALGTALGALLHIVFSPDSIRGIWEDKLNIPSDS